MITFHHSGTQAEEGEYINVREDRGENGIRAKTTT